MSQEYEISQNARQIMNQYVDNSLESNLNHQAQQYIEQFYHSSATSGQVSKRNSHANKKKASKSKNQQKEYEGTSKLYIREDNMMGGASP